MTALRHEHQTLRLVIALIIVIINCILSGHLGRFSYEQFRGYCRHESLKLTEVIRQSRHPKSEKCGNNKNICLIVSSNVSYSNIIVATYKR